VPDQVFSLVSIVSAVVIVLTTLLSYAVGWLIGTPALVPVLNALAGIPFMVASLRRGEVRTAIARMLLWALTMAVCATALSYLEPWRTDRLFVRGAAYRTEMFAWVASGRGMESRPSQFIPQQAMHATIFALLAVASGGMLALPMGAVLMNYMGHYVGMLAAASARPALTMILAWHPWAVIRVASFVVIGVILSAPMLGRVFRFKVDWAAARAPMIWACAGLLVDIALKALLAPAWQRLLLRVVGW
jgi:hypothetical protein